MHAVHRLQHAPPLPVCPLSCVIPPTIPTPQECSPTHASLYLAHPMLRSPSVSSSPSLTSSPTCSPPSLTGGKLEASSMSWKSSTVAPPSGRHSAKRRTRHYEEGRRGEGGPRRGGWGTMWRGARESWWERDREQMKGLWGVNRHYWGG